MRILTKEVRLSEAAGLAVPFLVDTQWCRLVYVGFWAAWPLSPNHPAGTPDHGRSRILLSGADIVRVVT